MYRPNTATPTSGPKTASVAASLNPIIRANVNNPAATTVDVKSCRVVNLTPLIRRLPSIENLRP